MSAAPFFQAGGRPQLIGVIGSAADLAYAKRLRPRPDWFELRLDCFCQMSPARLARWRTPLLITARHLAEGGRRTDVSRRNLLLRFLPAAQAVDVELRSLRELKDVWHEAKSLRRICSFHHFQRTPPLGELRKKLARAEKSGADLFKVVTAANTAHALSILREFLVHAQFPVCVMAVGTFGAESRLLFPKLGSRLIYAPLLRRQHRGQLTLAQWCARSIIRQPAY
ncbi:MAG: type I 3-dehydroquinate dehydratase [Verrucomicrobiota bacterium]|nr:type I 3-dehydroquinate dehydratase [Verrucomicrobiota bacterium]